MSKSDQKRNFLRNPVEHIDIKKIDSSPILEAMGKMSFTAREIAQAASVYEKMLSDDSCTVILALAGSTSSAGCMQVYADLVENNMVDVIVATGASIVDMDFFEALGFKHYQGTSEADDKELRELYIDRIYDTYIDEDDLQKCDMAIKKIADDLPARAYSSREFIAEMGRYLVDNAKKKNSLVELAYRKGVPIFCPAFSDSSAGFGLVAHQAENPDSHVSIDSVKDFRELTQVKIDAGSTGIFIIGGGVPKNFVQDTVVCAEILGHSVPMHKYAVQITVADVRDGACSSSTLKEAQSWGKVDGSYEQMVFSEASVALPLIASHVYRQKKWKDIRKEKRLSK